YKNIIIDHCSFSWCIDEVASFYDNRDFTMQWCTIAEALANPGHSKGAHSYGGIWGGKNASFHHNFIAHVQNRAPRFNGARYGWEGYDKTKYANTVQAEQVDFRNCLMYNWGTGGCYGGPGGGYINMVNNYYKAGPGTGSTKTRVTQVTVGSSGNADSKHPELYGYACRYYINGNYVAAAANPENYDWNGVSYDSGLVDYGMYKYIKDASHFYGDVQYQTINGVDCVRLRLDAENDPGEVTTHKAQNVLDKVMDYAGASLYRDAVDARYMEECRTGTATFTGEVSGRQGIVDFINDPAGDQKPNRPSYPELSSVTRPADWDTDGDGMPDAWEIANGLNPNEPRDGAVPTLDAASGYSNLEIYINSLVEHIMKAGNEGADKSVDEYYPSSNQSGISDVIAPCTDVDHIEYYDLRGIRLAEPAEGINIRRTVYTDGTVYTDKVIR
ncbi:MAG: thrombospondin type 3 repeat-containing protein, partial [Duncaniella sp.]|nr:thrombospondin type 3 repeat-containing protein [Duncaniella sp.]